MKHILFTILTVFLFSQCTENECCDQPPSGLEGQWNLVNISGGIGGFSCDYVEGETAWLFDSQDVAVDNALSLNHICGEAFPAGTYKFSIIAMGVDKFLIFDNEELGKMTLDQDELTIDRNVLSQGVGADNFVLRFQRN